MVKIFSLSFACGFIYVFEMGLGLIDSKVNIGKNIMRVGSDLMSVFSILILFMPRAPGVKMTVLAVLNFDYNR